MEVEECKVVNVNARKIRVERVEQKNLISGEIPVLKGMSVPQVNSFVVCIFNGSKGFLLGELE